MARTTSADGTAGGKDVVGRLSQLGNRTSLMVIDATLRAVPAESPATPGTEGQSFLDAAAEVRALSRRMMQAAKDFKATVDPGMGPGMGSGAKPPVAANADVEPVG